MPTSNLESQIVEVGDGHTDDEAALAKMGYKQELKYVRSHLVFEIYGTH
jgi:hypothetical protein